MKIAIIASRNFTNQVILENELNAIKDKVWPEPPQTVIVQPAEKKE